MNQTNYNHTEESYNNPINQSATEKPQDDVIDSIRMMQIQSRETVIQPCFWEEKRKPL